jgi:hypothetical protein
LKSSKSSARKEKEIRTMKLRNWMEEVLGKQIAWVNGVGSKGGRKIYCITFMDGSEEDFYIDFDHKLIEVY